MTGLLIKNFKVLKIHDNSFRLCRRFKQSSSIKIGMMRINFFIFFWTLIISSSAFSQNGKKLEKYLKINTTANFDPSLPIFFERKNPRKHAWESVSGYFNQAFATNGFTVLNAMPDEDQRQSKYIIVLDYVYGYAIARYKWQHSNLTGQIVDMSNPSLIAGTFSYDGNYNPSELSLGIALKLKTLILKGASAKDETPRNTTPIKTKEERLVELKGFFDRQLITNEEYEREKKKILSE